MATSVNKQIADLSISQLWSVSDKSSTNSDVLLAVFGLSGGITFLKGTDRALYFSVSMKLKIEFIFFCGVHNLKKKRFSAV